MQVAQYRMLLENTEHSELKGLHELLPKVEVKEMEQHNPVYLYGFLGYLIF